MIFQSNKKNVTWCTALMTEIAVLMATWKIKKLAFQFSLPTEKLKFDDVPTSKHVFFRKSSVKTCVKAHE